MTYVWGKGLLSSARAVKRVDTIYKGQPVPTASFNLLEAGLKRTALPESTAENPLGNGMFTQQDVQERMLIMEEQSERTPFRPSSHSGTRSTTTTTTTPPPPPPRSFGFHPLKRENDSTVEPACDDQITIY